MTPKSRTKSFRANFFTPHLSVTVLSAMVVLLVLLGATAFFQLAKLNETSRRVNRSQTALKALGEITSGLTDSETAQRGFLLSGDRTFLVPYERANERLKYSMATIAEAVKDNFEQSERVEKIKALAEKKIYEIGRTIRLYEDGAREESIDLVRSGIGREYMEELLSIARQVQQRENLILGERETRVAEQGVTLWVLVALAIILAPVLVAITVILMRQSNKRNERLRKEIQERHLAERELAESENFTRSVLESSADCVMALGLDGRLRSINGPGLKLMEVDNISRLAGQNWPQIWGDHRESAEEAIRQACNGGVGRFQGECSTPSGRVKWWDVIVTPLLDNAGKVVELLSIARDITVLKSAEEKIRESEARFRAIADTTPQMVWSARPDGVCDYFNEQWYQFTGMTRTEHELVNVSDHTDQPVTPWVNFIHPEDVPHTVDNWHQAIRTGDQFYAEYRLRSAGGDYRWFVARAIPIRDESGTITRWFGTSADIQNQKNIEIEHRELLASERAARADAERATRLKDEFVATLSHELRTPLNAILGWTQILQKGQCDQATVTKALDVLGRNARIQAQMIDDLLDMSRIMSGKLRLDVQRVNPAEIIDAVVLSVQPAADAKGVRLTKLLGSAGSVQGDPSRLHQVVWNLLTNAIKFTPKGGKVNISLRKEDSQIFIEVSDTGQGIAPEFIPLVFERFRQADGSTTRKFGGLGLGLSIVKNLVEMHGGTVHVASDGDGKGSLFSVHLPLSAVRETDSDSMVERSESLPASSLPTLDHLKILVVDDETDSRDLVQRILEESGAHVFPFSNVDDVMTFLREGGTLPDVIVSDIGMPVHDGYELIKRVRSMDEPVCSIPAAALTALARIEDRRRALLAGFQTHIAKPVDTSELIAVVASITHRIRPPTGLGIKPALLN